MSDLLPRIVGVIFFTTYAFYITRLQVNEILRFRGAVPIDDIIARAFVVLMFLLMALSYLLRLPARIKAVGFRERVFPFLCALLPIAVNETGGELAVGVRQIVATTLLFFGNSVSVWGLISLRHSFSIMAEVRELIVRGPYRFVRHPIYLGQILSTGGLLLLAPSYPSAALFLLFVVTQYARALFEERKLAAAIPEYRKYQARTIL